MLKKFQTFKSPANIPFKKFRKLRRMGFRPGKCYLFIQNNWIVFLIKIESFKRAVMHDVCVIRKNQKFLLRLIASKLKLSRKQMDFFGDFRKLQVRQEVLNQLKQCAEKIGGLIETIFFRNHI